MQIYYELELMLFKRRTKMKKLLIGALVLSSLSSFAQDNKKLTCFISAMTETGVSEGFSKDEVSPDLKNTGNGFFGTTIEIDVEAIKNHSQQAVNKTFRSDRLKSSQLQVGVTYWYQGGEFSSYEVSLAQETTNGRDISRASAMIPAVEGTSKIELRGKKALIKAEVECSID
jgi:hypothetical protein